MKFIALFIIGTKGTQLRRADTTQLVTRLVFMSGLLLCFVHLAEAAPWQARHGMTSAEYQQVFNNLTGQGYRLIDVCGYEVGGQDRYAAIWEQRAGPPWEARHGLTSAQYQQTFDDLQGKGYRLVHVSGYGVHGQDFYAAIWEKKSGSPWQVRHGMTSPEYQQAFDDLKSQGYRLVEVSGYSVGGQDRYAAIWSK